MKWCFNCIFPSSNNLFRESLRLFAVNYIWLLLLVIILITVTYAHKLGEPGLKGLYQVILGVLLLFYCFTYCMYWYYFGFRLGQQWKDSHSLFRCGVFSGLPAVMLNLVLPVIIYKLGFSDTGNVFYNYNVLLVQLLLFISAFLMPLICGLGAILGWEKAETIHVNLPRDKPGGFVPKASHIIGMLP